MRRLSEGRILRVLQFNPLNAQGERFVDIIETCRAFDVVCLIGTALVTQSVVEHHYNDRSWVLSAGRGAKGNKAVGVAILLNKMTFALNHIVSVFAPQAQRGRYCEARVRIGRADCTFYVVYMLHNSLRGCVGIATEITRVMHTRLSAQRWRSTPVLAMDLNDGIGVKKVARGRWESFQSISVGPYARDKHGAVSELMVPLIDKHSSCWLDTMHEAGLRWTFHGLRGKSRIDKVLIPAALMHIVDSFGVLAKLGRELQLICSSQTRDHLFLHMNIPVAFQAHVQREGVVAEVPERTRWSHDAMMDMLINGQGRQEFVEEALAQLRSAGDDWQRKWISMETQPLWNILNVAVLEVGKKHFLKRCKHWPEHADLAQQMH